MSRPTPSVLRKRAASWLPDDEARTPRRDEALERALESDGAPPEGTLTFALNSWMLALADADAAVLEVEVAADTSELRVATDDSCAPLAAFGIVVGARLAGRPVVVFTSPSDAALLGAFWSFDKGVRIAAPNEVPTANALLVAPHPDTCAAALLDGRETEDDYEALAQDVLALGGRGERSVRLIVAPPDVTPDAFLAACADLRALLPAESASTARLRMTAAFVEKSGTPCAYLDDYSLLVTRGDPDVLPPGQVRWVVLGTPDVADLLSRVTISVVTRRTESKRYTDLNPLPLGSALLPRGADLIGGYIRRGR